MLFVISDCHLSYRFVCQVQEFNLGQELRSMYMQSNSSTLIQGISTGLFNQSQVEVRADAGDEGFVIYDSAISLVQGLFPATTDYNTTLANGTTVVAPLNGYQYVPGENRVSSSISSCLMASSGQHRARPRCFSRRLD